MRKSLIIGLVVLMGGLLLLGSFGYADELENRQLYFFFFFEAFDPFNWPEDITAEDFVGELLPSPNYLKICYITKNTRFLIESTIALDESCSSSLEADFMFLRYGESCDVGNLFQTIGLVGLYCGGRFYDGRVTKNPEFDKLFIPHVGLKIMGIVYFDLKLHLNWNGRHYLIMSMGLIF